ncbi:MAG TPA: hypothetical protein VMX13_14970 [Sedimentisphaerales bacterium]|nr:hypothetical protein [Sedimentisphaerales bacterium]
MIEMDLDHCRIVEQSLCGQRSVDEQTFASLAVLGERLERLRKASGVFAEIGFSPAVKKLKREKSVLAVG